MKRRAIGGFAVVVIALAIGWALWHSSSRPSGRKNLPAVGAEASRIRTSRPERRDFAVTCRWFGKVESKTATSIVSLESGRIILVAVREGQQVDKGEALFELGGPRVTGQRRALKAQVQSLKERVKLAARDVEAKRKAIGQRLVTLGELTAAEGDLARLRSELQSAKMRLSHLLAALHIRAPVSGVFTDRRVSVGQEVAQGAVLGRLIDPKSLRVVAHLFPPEGAQLVGRRAIIDAGNRRSLSGTVSAVRPERTPEGATIVWLEGPDFSQHLTPNETLTGEIVLSKRKSSLAVPAGAIVRDEREQCYVFLKQGDSYHRQAVTTGLTSEGWMEITSGIKETDEVVVQGAYELFYQNFSKTFHVAD